MRSVNAEGELLARLSAIGVHPTRLPHADVRRTWDALRAFASETVEDVLVEGPWGDAWVAQHGAYGGGTFALDMTRQFQFAAEDGTYSHMAQLSCTVYFKPFPALKGIASASLWSPEFELDAFFDRALELPGFARVLEHEADAKGLRVEHSTV